MFNALGEASGLAKLLRKERRGSCVSISSSLAAVVSRGLVFGPVLAAFVAEWHGRVILVGTASIVVAENYDL